MKKCRYIPENQLPPEASHDHVQTIIDSIASGDILVFGTAKRMVEHAWGLRVPDFVESVCAHLEAGHRLFRKPINDPPPNLLFFHANVGLYPDSTDEYDDVYVEIRLRDGLVVIICDSHTHLDGIGPRLPK